MVILFTMEDSDSRILGNLAEDRVFVEALAKLTNGMHTIQKSDPSREKTDQRLIICKTGSGGIRELKKHGADGTL